MARLKIQNIGPIRQGIQGAATQDGFLDFKGVTVFIGNQGTGKSTVAKIFSTMSWIEKALVRKDFSPNHLPQYKRFKKQLAYQGIDNYLTSDSVIEYVGKAFHIKYENENLDISESTEGTDYRFPKIMYVPAERNFISTVERPDLLKRLPQPLYTFLDEYDGAKQDIGRGIDLPLGNLRLEYQKQYKRMFITGESFKVNLLEASSGFQSLVPLFLVTQHLSKAIHPNNITHKQISLDEEKRIRKMIDEILENESISEDVKQVLFKRLSARFRYDCFLNIVEEPEQNLYPTSQKKVLFHLLEHKNIIEDSGLVITTHSPYIINYLTLAIKAHLVKSKIGTPTEDNSAHLSELESIVPSASTVSPDYVNIYEIDDSGSIEKLPDYHGIPTDDNYLNQLLAHTNEEYDKLIEIEEALGL